MPWLDVEKIKSTSFVTITRTKFVKEQLVDTFTVQGKTPLWAKDTTIFSEEEQNFLKSRHLPLRYKCQYELGIYNVALNNKALRDSKRGSLHRIYDVDASFIISYFWNADFYVENENKRVRPLAYSNSANDLNSHHKRSSTSISTSESYCKCNWESLKIFSDYSDHQLSYSYHQILDESSKTRKENELLKRRVNDIRINFFVDIKFRLKNSKKSVPICQQ